VAANWGPAWPPTVRECEAGKRGALALTLASILAVGSPTLDRSATGAGVDRSAKDLHYAADD